MELDDVVNSASLHPAVSVISTALSIGYNNHCSGKQLLAAIVAGYELCIKLGIALNPAAHYAQGFHPTGTCGTFGAAVTAAKILKLNRNKLLNSMGIAGSQASGSMEFLTDGAYTKRFHAGWAAHSGIIAARLADFGFTGPASILEGQFGFLNGYSQKADPAAVLKHWGQPYEVMNTSIKPHACCRYKQGAIDCLIHIVEENLLKPADIEKITISVLDAGFSLVAEPRDKKQNPQSVVDAQFSMPFGAALAVLRKNAFLDRYAIEEINNPEIKNLMNKVHCIRDPELNVQFPRMWPAKVEVVTIDGKRYQHQLDHPKGDPENPLSWYELIFKFKALASAVFSADQCDDIIGMVRKLDKLDDVSDIMRRLRVNNG